jgi:chemotaxis protein MotB
MIVEEDAHGATAEEGENYFVSMTDMMVGVLFIFIIMLMVFALDFRTKTDVQKVAIEEAQNVAAKVRDLQEQVRQEIDLLDKAAAVRRRLLEDIKNELAAANIHVEISPKSDVLRITENAVRFRFSSSELDPDTRRNVGTIATILHRILGNYIACRQHEGEKVCAQSDRPTIETVFIEGHTDIRGDDRSNWQLSTTRAAATYREMITSAPELRMFLNRDSQEVLSVSGYSSTRPIDTSQTPQAWDANRRIDLRFVMENDSRQRFERLRQQTDGMQHEIKRLIEAIGGTP